MVDYRVKALYLNRDYEPYAAKRDNEIRDLIESAGGHYYDYKDHVIREKSEVLSNSGTPYTVFTPYKKKWLALLRQEPIPHFDSANLLQKLIRIDPEELFSLESIGFKPSQVNIPSMSVDQRVIASYEKTRNFPSLRMGTSRLGIHFRFGTISIRQKALKALQLNETYLSELIWRDFYSQILYHFPHVVDRAFRAKYDTIEWRDNNTDYVAWTLGMTGYPIVDAGMRELNATGYMHNRVRMIAASFLTKHLLLNWRLGEGYFAQKLLDFDLASNNGGWQWASGSGTDAAPYFRIFNPTTQLQKFDKELVYVKQWVPEYGTEVYLHPIVDHKFARQRCLETYKRALS